VRSAIAGTAAAQSSVTIYGKIDQAFAKTPGSKDKQILDTANTSRIGFRGVEDLGGGLAAVFGFEHRFTPDNGAANAIFWNGYSTVGLRGPWGTVNLGRQYVAAFSLIQNQIDPWAGETIVNLRDVGMRPGNVTQARVSDSVRYDFSASGVNVAASIGEATQVTNPGPDRPFSIAANYAAGPLFVGVGFENPTDDDDQMWSLGARYAFGPATVSAGFSSGKNTLDQTARGWLLGLNYNIGTGDVKVGYATSRVNGTTNPQKVGLGYHHNLSKRTKLFVDVANDRKLLTSKTGYDLGIQHNF
jgi:predicted porin